jgi:hypothetical protein
LSNTNVQELEPVTTALGEIDVEDAILKRWEVVDEDQPTENSSEATSEEVIETDDQDVNEEEEIVQETDEELDEDPVEETEESEEETSEDPVLTDDSLIDITIDGKNEQASLKDLKRLYGQEASLTRKSQETSARRKEADEALERTSVQYQKMLERAEKQWEPYSKVDMLVAAKQMSDEDFAQLRNEARVAEDNLKFIKEESNSFYDGFKQEQAKQQQLQAQECIKTLQNDVPDWSNDLYNSIRTYAVNQGLQQDQVDQYVDPSVIKILNKARLYDESKKTAATKKASKPPVKVLRSKKAPASSQDAKQAKTAAAIKRMQEGSQLSGNLDDIAEVLLSRWET